MKVYKEKSPVIFNKITGIDEKNITRHAFWQFFDYRIILFFAFTVASTYIRFLT